MLCGVSRKKSILCFYHMYSVESNDTCLGVDVVPRCCIQECLPKKELYDTYVEQRIVMLYKMCCT